MLLFGPESNVVTHEPEDRFLEVFEGIATSEDVVAEAAFHNPYSTEDKTWKHGFLLRDGAGNYHHLVKIDSHGYWSFFYRLGDRNLQCFREELSSSINAAPGGNNTLRVAMIGVEGWVYINGQYQGNLDLSAITQGGDIKVFVEDDQAGETRFEDFTVWKWDAALAKQLPEVVDTPTPTSAIPINPKTPVFGPESGVIEHEPDDDGAFELFRGLVLSGDVMIEATFHNSYDYREGPWNHGILLQSAQPNTYHWIYVDSQRRWVHSRRSGQEGFTFARATGARHRHRYFRGGKIRLRLVARGRMGWVYVNDRFMGNINFDLGDIPNPDPISLVIDDEKDGATKFEDFRVWRWHPSLYDLPE